MKKVLLLTLCLVLLITGCGKNKTNNNLISFEGYNGSKDAVMTINGENVSADEFNYFLIMSAYDLKNSNNVSDEDFDSFWSKTDSESGKTYADMAIEDAIKDCRLYHVYRTEALKQGISLTDEDKKTVEDQAYSMKTNYGEDMYKLQLKAGGLTPEAYYNITEMGYYSTRLYSRFIGNFRKITADEIKTFYRDNYVRAKHILILTTNPETGEEYSEEQKNNAVEKIKEVYVKLKNGEDFDRLMREYTEDTGYETNPDGYTFTENDDFIEGFKTTAFSLEEGAVSEIMQTEYGYHIIKREPLLDDYADKNVEPIQEKIFETEFQAQLDKWCEDAKIIGNRPVFEKLDPGAVLSEYLKQYDETLELIKQEFMKINGDAE